MNDFPLAAVDTENTDFAKKQYLRKCPTLPQLWQTTPVAGHFSPGWCLSRQPQHVHCASGFGLDCWFRGRSHFICPSNLGFDGGVGLLPEWWSLSTVASLMFVWSWRCWSFTAAFCLTMVLAVSKVSRESVWSFPRAQYLGYQRLSDPLTFLPFLFLHTHRTRSSCIIPWCTVW